MELTLIIVGLIAILIAIFLFRYRIVGLMGSALNLIFVLMIILGITSLFLPQLYTALADQTLQQTGTLTSIRSFDSNISTVTNAPQDIWQGLLNLIGGNKPTEVKPDTSKSGPLETSLYPNLVGVFTLIYRVLALIISIAGMLIVIYLSYSTLGASKLTRLQHDYHELKKRIEQLENEKIGSGSSTATPSV